MNRLDGFDIGALAILLFLLWDFVAASNYSNLNWVLIIGMLLFAKLSIVSKYYKKRSSEEIWKTEECDER